MKLFEITTGFYGNSYERAHVWAETEQKARNAFKKKHKAFSIHDIRMLFDGDCRDEFVTDLSSDGWE